MKNIIFIAPPAGGKGTQSDFLIKKYGYVHLSTGNILREEISKSDSKLSEDVKNIIKQGLLVSDDIIISILKDKMNSIKGQPFILDGFPRTMTQAKFLTEMFKELELDNYIVIFLDVDKEISRRRITGRLTCTCGKSYNIYNDVLKPKVDGICDLCGKELYVREDDTEEKFIVRYDSYLNNTVPIVKYYKQMGKLIRIDTNHDDSNITTKDVERVVNDQI